MSDLPERPLLFHYTKSIGAVISILENGFLLVPNRRELINDLLDPILFADREPQQFGMVSFTEISPADAVRHRQRFGDFGIAVTRGWAQTNGAQRVIYVDRDGPVLETLRWLFELGKQDLDARMPDAGAASMALKNKALAAVYGSDLYANLLTLYEFMQPERDSPQVEWRVVNRVPLYTNEEDDRSALIANLLQMAKMWKTLGSVRVEPDDIAMLICPRNTLRRLRKELPDRFRHVRIEPYSTAGLLDQLITRLSAVAELRRLAKSKPHDHGYSARRPGPRSSRVPGVAELPFVTRIQGLHLRPNAVIGRFLCHIQYTDDRGEWLQLTMPILDALYLLNLLRAMEDENPPLRALNTPPGTSSR